ncbi:SHOCT domain-containing protein [Rhodococcus sp. BP-241]|uniref:SHOCT domain-containing protein n=1 Tax=Rhodococcus sp. BP-241 TaxID=2739441 RepID=UPI001C9ABD8F|nr:SHOCT domain-containing protein [Rhodococcus sp. BP-241]MBY6709075.1 SHOCT domain-containing protein [Rhodococcus sp. BP-241]
MSTQFSPKLKDKTAQAWCSALSAHLHPGEQVWALAKTNSMRPLIDGVAITNARVVGFLGGEVAAKGFKVAVDADEFASFDLVKKFGSKALVVRTLERGEVSFGSISDAEADFVRHYVGHLAASGYPQNIRAAAEARRDESARIEQLQQDGRRNVRTIGNPVKDKEWETVRSHAAPTEVPWFVINSGGGYGFLAAFEDRLIIAKVSATASIMAGSFGGGRVTTFPYSQITNIEYNGGMVNGVLEVLTPSYQGTGNHDFWRSSGLGRNKAADDPRTLSNCLPLARHLHKEALPLLVELQRKISESSRPTITVHAPHPEPARGGAGGGSGLADELRNLAELHSQGVLDSDEFAAAKRAAITKHT